MLDRLARALEGGGRGTPSETFVDLSDVLPASALAQVGPVVVDFYRSPLPYSLRVGVAMGRWSRLLMGCFALLCRQSGAPDRGAGVEAYEVCQRLYRDRRGRTHWDRYARVDGRLRRLFVARIASGPERFYETFVLYGLPITLAFAVCSDGDALLLSLQPRESSLLARMARVTYRTAPLDSGLATEGDFRVPLIGLRVRMHFRMRPLPRA